MSNSSDKIWAYLHGELSSEEMAEFQQKVKKSAELRQALDERKSTHLLLRDSMPHMESDTDDSVLVNQLLADWEKEHPEFKEQPTYSRGKIIRLYLPLAAAAAATFIFFGISWKTGAILWKSTVYGTAPQLRDDTAIRANYSRSELKNVNRIIQKEIESELANLTDTPIRWILEIQIQELAKGALIIEVSGYPEKNPNSPKVWSTSLHSLDSLQKNIKPFTQQIAVHLAGPDHK